jgi:hypothetical protein
MLVSQNKYPHLHRFRARNTKYSLTRDHFIESETFSVHACGDNQNCRQCGLDRRGPSSLCGSLSQQVRFQGRPFAKLGKVLPSGTQLNVTNAMISGDWAIVELASLAAAKNGLRFDNKYCCPGKVKFKTTGWSMQTTFKSIKLLRHNSVTNPSPVAYLLVGYRLGPRERRGIYYFYVTIFRGIPPKPIGIVVKYILYRNLKIFIPE